MEAFNFNDKTFLLVKNSQAGTVDAQTVFRYRQSGSLVTADYEGGSIKYGKIIAILRGSELEMLYQCITKDDELKAGKAIADVSKTENGKLKLKLRWEWLDENGECGISVYIEQ